MTDKWIRLFEHQSLRIGQSVSGGFFGERHWRKLARFLEASRYPYFQMLPDGVRFRQYVGVLQVEELTIEIVPKTDRSDGGDTGPWQQALIDMLQACRLWRGEWISGARLTARPGGLLEWYCRYFLEQTDRLLRQGLLKTYERRQQYQTALRGRLLLHRQLTETRPVFWTEQETFNYNHPYNQWLCAALDMLITHYPDESLQNHARALRRRFPPIDFRHPARLPVLSDPVRETAYRRPLMIARLLLKHFSPLARRGDWPLLAILFDMNALFEEYIARQLENGRPTSGRIQRQIATPFWNRRSIRPDLVLDYKGKRYVIDTKWKIPPRGQPDMADIRQIYVYNDYFGADEGILLYPETGDFREWPAEEFSPAPGRERRHACRMLAAPVVTREGRLNPSLGSELWARLGE